MKVTLEMNRVKVTREIPTSWKEVTFRQFLKLEECKQDYYKIFALFLGEDEAVIRKAKIYGLDSVLLAMKFLQSEPVMEIPKTMLGRPIPKDLGFETVAQFMDLRKDIENSANLTQIERLERYTLYCAMYCVDPYDWQKAEDLAPQFLDQPAPEVLAVGHFTLLKLIGLTSSITKTSQKASTRWKKFRQGLTVWLRNTGVMVRYFIWKKKQDFQGK